MLLKLKTLSEKIVRNILDKIMSHLNCCDYVMEKWLELHLPHKNEDCLGSPVPLPPLSDHLQVITKDQEKTHPLPTPTSSH